MICLILKGHSFQYELEHLVKAFYPGKLVQCRVEIVNEGVTIRSIWNGNCFRAEIYEDGIMTVWHQKEEKVEQGHRDIKKRASLMLKQVVYKVLEEYTERSLPWGILTGIRPTKIVHEFLGQNMSREEIGKQLLEQYCIHPEKVDLMINVAEKEKKILDQNKKNEISLYIGIPFCPTRCLYCSFTSYPIEQWKNQVQGYLSSIEKELQFAHDYGLTHPIRSIYIGGGTPTSLDTEELEKLMQLIQQYLPARLSEEFTVEAGRPDTITEKKLMVLKQYGVDRISINPQTMNQVTLQRIGRNHTVEDIIETFQLARKIGHKNINMDIILGLPGETIDDVAHTMKQLQILNPESITVHTMAIKRASRLRQEITQYELKPENDVEKMLEIAAAGTKEMGMEPYYLYRQKNMIGNFENVGYSKPGTACIYNIQIMEEKQTILALGAGAITKVVYPEENRIERVENVKNVEQYMSRIDEMVKRKMDKIHI